MQYNVTVGNTTHTVSAQTVEELDVVDLGEGALHLLHRGKTYRCHVQQVDRAARSVRLSVNGRELTATLDGPLEQLITQLGFATKVSATDNLIEAPMPGLILSIAVREGQQIEAGTPLLILEAMKMENVIKATGEGTVRRIAVRQGEAVEKRQLLIELA